MSIKLLVLMLCCCMWHTLPSFGQRGYFPGYVVLNNGDTLNGRVKDRKERFAARIYNKIRLKNGGLFTKKFAPRKIIAYRRGKSTYERFLIGRKKSTLRDIFNTNLYIVPWGGEFTFFRIAHKGPLSYYYHEFESDDDYFDFEAYFKLEGNNELVHTNTIFGLRRKSLVKFFDGCPKLVEAIKNKELREPMDIVNYYEQHCISPGPVKKRE